jgi:hypothetical protein
MHSDYIIYVDESGDHGLASIDSQYPLFVLSFCIFNKTNYRNIVVPAFLDLKFATFGHDMVVLHSHEIRKTRGPFRILFDKAVRSKFLSDLDAAIEASPFTLISAIIDKPRLIDQHAAAENPYHVALAFCMEQAFGYLKAKAQQWHATTIVFESRGSVEDRALEQEFKRVADGGNQYGILPFDIVFADKRTNSTGLQIADLVSHPIGRHHLNPEQPNHAYAKVEPKFRRGPEGVIHGWGLKVFQ